MKQWVKKLVDQFSDLEWDKNSATSSNKSKDDTKNIDLTEEKATLLFFIDIYNKHLFDIDSQPVRKVREQLDQFARELLSPDQKQDKEKLFFKIRQFFASYRIEEYSYLQKSFDDFKNIVWQFADHLAEDIEAEKKEEAKVKETLAELRNAIEANSLQELKQSAKQFIDQYVENQTKREKRISKRLTHLKSNLQVVKKELVEANTTMRTDHLTGAFNRRSFDEEMRKHYKFFEATSTTSCLAILDIDHFKKINDTFGHDVGDFVLKEFVRILQDTFTEPGLFLARTGGEEFAVIFPEWSSDRALAKIEEAHNKVRKEVFIHDGKQIRYTMSAGIANLTDGDTIDSWIKKADEALYHSKHSGRNRSTISGCEVKVTTAAS
ncbi:MAG: GGDEF domain-containing protein [Bdellovibrionia bacterium]